ncbi:uncharacterized protein LOC134055630 isoform X2 [Cinclus cinclus]|uniref:uncharacterized protein LOC134055630 isoform X2 n=1 Tax=Cinclus cinclus TaxID=127875 RepID=UPI002E0D9FF4
MASMNRILELYNHPFEDDFVVSLDTLTYDTPEGPKRWGQVSRKDIKKWKKEIFKYNRRSQKNREKSKQQSSDFEDEHSTVQQESSENSGVDTSDTVGETIDTVSVRKIFEDIHLQNTDDGQIQKTEGVPLDLIVRAGEREMPKWITITPPRSSAGHRSTSPGQELFVGEKDDAVSVRRRFKDIQLQNTDDGQIQKTERVPLDLIVRAGEREMPKWITITPPRSSAGHRSTSPGQELFGNQAVVRRRKLELSNKCSLSKYLCLHRSGAPISSNTVAFPRHQACPELSLTSCEEDGEYRSADEECSWSNMTLADLYPAMVEIFTKLMAKHSERKVLKYMFGHLRSKRWPSRRSKLSVTLDKMRGFRPTKLKGAFHSPCSCRSEDSQSPTSGNESREFFCDNSLISNSSGLVPSAYTDTNDIKMVHSNSSLEHLASGKDQEVCKHTASPDIMDRMGETFIIEDELETTASPKNSEYTESEKLPYKRFSEPSFITSTASSGSRVPHLVKERETEKADFCVGSSEFCSSVCSSHSDSNNAIPTTNCSPARSSNTAFIYPERQTSFQHKGSFSSWFMKQSPKKMPNKYDDAFEELYYKVCSEEFQKSLTLTRPLINSQNLEEKGRLVKSNSSDFGPSTKQCDMEFDRMYEKLCRESVPKFFGFQTASNFRKCEEIQAMSRAFPQHKG